MKHNSWFKTSGFHRFEQAAVVGATILSAISCQRALSRLNEPTHKPSISTEAIGTPVVLPTVVAALSTATMLPLVSATVTSSPPTATNTDVPAPPTKTDIPSLKLVTATPTETAAGVAPTVNEVALATPTSGAMTTPQPPYISVITSTPAPIATRVNLNDVVATLISNPTTPPEQFAARHATEQAMLSLLGAKVTLTPAVAPMEKIYTPVATPTNWPVGVATPTIDPNDPLKFDPFHVRVMDALRSVNFTILPVERDAQHQRWIFRWTSAWAPPMLDGLPSVSDRGSPYTFVPRFVIRRYPFNFAPSEFVIDQYPVMFGNEYKNEVQLSDRELPEGTYAFAVRGELFSNSPNFKEVTPWTEWRLIEIKK